MTFLSFSQSLHLELPKKHVLHYFCLDLNGTLWRSFCGVVSVVFSCSKAFEVQKCSLIWMKETHTESLHEAGVYAENTRGK